MELNIYLYDLGIMFFIECFLVCIEKLKSICVVVNVRECKSYFRVILIL